MKFAKLALSLGLAGLTAAHAAVNYVGDTGDAEVSTTIDLSSSPTSLYGGSYDSATQTWTWSASDTFVLQELIFVRNGTLVIDAGSVVRGQPRTDGSTFNPGALVIVRGAKLIADGTAQSPIIFTSASTTGATTGGRASGASPTFWDANPLTSPQACATAGNWGGVIVLGNAPTNVDRDTAGEQEFFDEHGTFTVSTDDRSSVEGIPSTAPASVAGYDRFGGHNAADNSGVIRYVSIRHGGANLASNAEINGLTLGGVGRATTIDYVEIWGNTDDGVEIFGGNVNLKHVAIFNPQDDGLDIDVGYQGTVQFLLVVGGTSTDKLGEWDGSYEGETVNGFSTTGPVTVTKTPVANYNVINATFVGNPGAVGFNNSLHIRDQSAPRLINSIFINPNGNPIEVDNRGTEDEQDSPRRFQQGLAEFRGVTCYSTAGSFTTVAAWVAAGGNDTIVETALGVASRVNLFNSNPGFNKVPTSSDGALAASLALNVVPNSSGGAASGSFDAVFDDSIAGYNNSIEVVTYRGAFDAASLTRDLWTTGWTAAEKSDVIVAKGNGTN